MARPRSQAAHARAIEAAVAALVDSGVEGVTFEEVAARSGVARSTLYRHFGSKGALLVQAARQCIVEHPTPDTGDLASDIRALFDGYGKAEEERNIPGLLPMLIDEATRDEEMHCLVDELLEERLRPLRTILRLAQARGEISEDLDLEVALSLLIGPITHRRIVQRLDITPEFKQQVFELTLVALRSTAPAPSNA